MERPRRGAGAAIAGASAVLVLAAAFAAAWAFMPGLVAAALPEGSAVVAAAKAVLGPPQSAIATAFVLVVTVTTGMAGLAVALRRLSGEERALDQARAKAAALTPQDLAGAAGQSPFLVSGSTRIAAERRMAVYAMTENIRKDAESFRFEPIAMIVDRVAGDLLGGSQRLRDAQQLGLRLGILGTFVGMSLALVDAGTIFSAGGDEAAQEAARAATSEAAIEGIIGRLSLAFGTSIAGLVAAIGLQIAAWGVRERESALITGLQVLAADLQALYRRAEAGGGIGADIAVLGERIVELGRDLAHHRASIGVHAAEMGATARTVAGVFEQPLDALERTGARLAELLALQDGAVRGLGETTRAVGDLQERTAGHFDAALGRATAAQEAGLRTVQDEIRALSEALLAEIRGARPGGPLAEALAPVAARFDAAGERLAETARLQRRVAGGLVVVALVLAIGAGALGWMLAAEPGRAAMALPDRVTFSLFGGRP